MIEYENLYEIVKSGMSEKRFKHTEGVVKRAIEYAEVYNVDINTVKLVAVAHDIAKEFSEEKIKECIEKYKIELDEIESKSEQLVHAKIGAYVCKNEYGFDEDMFNAIRFHTTGRENMSLLEKIIYLADATEENRKYCSQALPEIIKEDIDKGMVEILKSTFEHVLSLNSMIHLDSIRCYNYYVEKTK